MVNVSHEEISLDIRNSIQFTKEKTPYPPLLRPPSSLLNPLSLELCTESLGSETGSDGFTYAEEFYSYFSPFSSEKDSFEGKTREKKQWTVNTRCSAGWTSPQQRSFPPPLSSAFIQIRPFRSDGHLILKSVSVPSRKFVHVERHSGRLVLSFLSKSVKVSGDDDEEREEEVLVVDRGTVVEVKVSTKPRLLDGFAVAKVLRPSLVINKFAVWAPLATADVSTTAAGAKKICWRSAPAAEGEAKLLFRSKRRSWEELLREIMRCSELRRPLLILQQPYCVAASILLSSYVIFG